MIKTTSDRFEGGIFIFLEKKLIEFLKIMEISKEKRVHKDMKMMKEGFNL